MKLWLDVDEVSPHLGDSPAAIYDAIRRNQFPFEFVKIGRRIKISARSIGLVPHEDESGPQFKALNSEAQSQGESLAATA